MSMISELVKELRRADNPVGGYYRTLYARSADTIEELSAKLATANIERSTAYYNDGWIPCSERLPKKAHSYVVTEQTKDGRYIMSTRIFRGGKWVIEELYDDVKVIAWMPAEPYKGVE